jgi:hypothetical protein
MKRTLRLCATILATLTALPAKADDFAISFNGGPLGYSGSGIFSGTETSAGIFDITSVLSGNVTDPGFGTSSIVSMSSYALSDNLLYFPGGGQYFDDSGLAFTLANGVSINLYEFIDGGTLFQAALQSNPAGDIPENATFNVATTPEPSSLILMMTAAALGLGAFYQRRMQSAQTREV